MTRHFCNFTSRFREKDHLCLTVGICLLAIAVLIFAGIASNALSDTWLSLLDVEISNWLHARSTPALTAIMLLITEIHRPFGISIMASVCALVLGWQKRWYALLVLAMAVPGGLLLNLLLKNVFQRARPVFDEPLLILTTYSFPSGHALGSTVFYGTLAAFAYWYVPDWRWRLLAFTGSVLMITLVAFTRIYLGVHYFSDVLAGIMEGLAWLAFCLIVVDILRKSFGTSTSNRL
ncbi:MAG: phosphatase PAP2 family protein [Gammaproteobacteria bacterium]